MLNERRKALNIQCCIGIKGQLDPSWQEWFEDLQILPQASGKTLLCGSVLDQAALYRVLLKINSLGLTLLSLEIGDAVSLQESEEETPPLGDEQGAEQTASSFRRDEQRTGTESVVCGREVRSRTQSAN